MIERIVPMLRLFCALGALSAVLVTLTAFGAISAYARQPTMIGKEHPVLLGRMVVTAAALPPAASKD